jgi:hypothetical protein
MHTPQKVREDLKLVIRIKEKLRKNNALITNADKGNTIVIIYHKDYNQKVLNFISDNKAIEVNNNITTKFQKDLRNTLNNCKQIVGADNKWRYVNLNPDTPLLRGLVKVHKKDLPVRPIVNYRSAPCYRLAKMFSEKLKTYIPLPYIYNIQNSVQLMKDLSDFPFSPNLKVASLDISNMYTKIHTEELLNIIDIMCDKHSIEDTLKLDITEIAKLIIAQNCFKFRDKTYLQKNGLAMGAQRHPLCPKSICSSLKHKNLRYPTVLKGGRLL